MRHEYAGDVGDYVKYALLRAICAAAPGLRLGVVWYLTDHAENGADGRQRPHLTADGWEQLDPKLLAELRRLDKLPGGITLEHIEKSPILPGGTVFISEPMPGPEVPAPTRAGVRALWFDRARTAVAGCDLLFLDPDNGLEVASIPANAPRAGKYAMTVEVAALLSGATPREHVGPGWRRSW